METFLVTLGLIGVLVSLGAYALLTRGMLTKDDARYYWLNIVGTVLIGLSLIVQWNIGAVVSQILWIIISVIGLVRAKRRPV